MALIHQVHEYRPWALFDTKTFRVDREPHPEQLDKLFKVFVMKMNKHLYGSKFWKDKQTGVSWVRAAELQRRGITHFHSMFGGPGVSDLADTLCAGGKMRARYWEEIWWDMAGICRMELIQNVGLVEGYCSKYVVKQEGLIDFGGPLAPVEWSSTGYIYQACSPLKKEQAQFFDGVNVGLQGKRASDADLYRAGSPFGAVQVRGHEQARPGTPLLSRLTPPLGSTKPSERGTMTRSGGR